MTRIVDPPLGQFEERLLAELKEVVASQTAHDTRPARVPRRRRAALLAVTATGAAAVAAVGLVLTVPGRTAPGPSPSYTLAGFMTAAAAAARAQDTSLPGPAQAFYEKVELVWSKTNAPNAATRECAVRWDLYPLSGKGVDITVVGKDACGSGFARNLKLVARLSARGPEMRASHYYPPLDSLPGKPAPLRSALYTAAGLGAAYWNMQSFFTADDVVFTLAGRLLEAPLPGTLRAAVYQVIAGLPGVTLVRSATDAVGRHGVGIQLSLLPAAGVRPAATARWVAELIIDPATYKFLGMDTEVAGTQWESADIGSGLVTRPAA
jgi:hypothetical protein